MVHWYLNVHHDVCLHTLDLIYVVDIEIVKVNCLIFRMIWCARGKYLFFFWSCKTWRLSMVRAITCRICLYLSFLGPPKPFPRFRGTRTKISERHEKCWGVAETSQSKSPWTGAMEYWSAAETITCQPGLLFIYLGHEHRLGLSHGHESGSSPIRLDGGS